MRCDRLDSLLFSRAQMEWRISNTPKVLKECAEELAEPLTLLFKQSLEEGQLPQSWKEANVSLIFGKGSRSRISSYRPISLKSVCCKIMKKIVRRAVINHMTDNMTLCLIINMDLFTEDRAPLIF